MLVSVAGPAPLGLRAFRFSPACPDVGRGRSWEFSQRVPAVPADNAVSSAACRAGAAVRRLLRAVVDADDVAMNQSRRHPTQLKSISVRMRRIGYRGAAR